MTTPRLPWPQWASEEYALLSDLCAGVSSVLEVCTLTLSRSRPNCYIVDDLLVGIIDDTQRIEELCRQIANAKPKRLNKKARRMPDWVLSASESGIVIAGDITSSVTLARRMLKLRRARSLVAAIEDAAQAAQVLSDCLKAGPAPEDCLSYSEIDYPSLETELTQFYMITQDSL